MNKLRAFGWLFPVRLLIFWLVFFAAFRAFFIGMNRPKWASAPPAEIWKSLLAALPLDGSTAAYAMVLPMIFWLVGLFFQKKWLENGAFWASVLSIAAFVFGLGANTFLYPEWDSLLNNRALAYLKTPAALLDSMSVGFQILCVLLYGSLVWLWVKIMRFWVFGVENNGFFIENGRFWPRLAAVPIFLSGVFLLLRGSVGVMAVNESAVYFSENLFANHAAVNPIWHFVHSLVEARTTTNKYRFLEENEAKRLVAALFSTDSTSQKPVFKNENVVVILMESMASQMFNDSARTPNLHRLAREGLFFSDIFGSGFRTDQGLVSVLSGYPAQPDQSIILLDDKAEKLPSLPRFFKKRGFSTLFCYGGELTFANIGQFLRTQGFEKLVSETDFSSVEKTQRWGADDATMLTRFAEELEKMREPFFAAGLTLSLHAPFDVPNEPNVASLAEPEKFRRAAAFADRAIGQFFEKVKNEAWFDHTIFVLTADHGHGLPNQIPLENAAARQVPLIFWGKPLGPDFRRKRIERTGGQHDLAATLVSLFESQNVDFQWSRNLFSTTTKPFGYWSNEHQLGWKDSAGEVHQFDFDSRKWTVGNESREAQAFLQIFYDDFLRK